MFSSRLPWHLTPNRLTDLLAAKRRGGAEILDLTESNPTRAGFIYPAHEISEALGNAESIRYDPTPSGLPVARQAVVAYYRDRGTVIEPDRVLVTASTSEAYSYLFKLLANPGDEVLIPQPSYPLLESLAGLESVRLRSYSLVYHEGWEIDFDSLAGNITPATRALVIVNPNNPTGSFVKKHEIEKLVTILAGRDIAVISDEVFSDYSFGPDADRVSTLAACSDLPVFSLSGLSKIAGLPQLKLGWIVLGGPAGFQAQAKERLEWIADSYLSVGAPVQHALPQLLALAGGIRSQISQRVRENLQLLQAAVRNSACRLLASEGGWYSIAQAPRTQTDEQWSLTLLEQDNVLVQPGFFYDFEAEAFLVISLLPPADVFREGLKRIVERIRI